MLNMEGIKIEKLEGNPPTLTPTNNSSLPSVTRKELESTSTKTLVLASSLSSTYSSILSLSSSSSTYYSWRAQAARPWCWPHQFSPPRPESQIWRLELVLIQSFSKRFLTQIFTWRRCLTIMKRWPQRRSRIRRRNWKRKSSLLSRTRIGRWGYVFNDICTNIIIIIISTIIFIIAMPYMQESSGGLKAFDSFHNVEKVDPHSMRWPPPIVRNYFGVKMFSYQEPK